MAKLKYGLKKKYQKETNRLGSVDISYDGDGDEIYMAVALRKDVTDKELFERIVQGIHTAFSAITGDGEIILRKETEDAVGYGVKEKGN
jgi:hypothetical protein